MQCICSVTPCGRFPPPIRTRAHTRTTTVAPWVRRHARNLGACLPQALVRMRDCVQVCATASYPKGYAGASSAPLAEAVEREPTDLGPRDEVRKLRLGHLPCRWCDDQRLWLALPCRRPMRHSLVGKHGTRTCGAGAPGLGCGVRTRMARRSESFRRHTIRRGTESIATPAAGGHEGDLGAAQTTDSGCSGWRSEGRGEDRRTTGQNSVEAARREREAGEGRPGAAEGGVGPPCFPSSSSCTSPRIVFANRRIVSVYLSSAGSDECMLHAACSTQHATCIATCKTRGVVREDMQTQLNVFTLSFRKFPEASGSFRQFLWRWSFAHTTNTGWPCRTFGIGGRVRRARIHRRNGARLSGRRMLSAQS
jgi:hypothetical protein